MSNRIRIDEKEMGSETRALELAARLLEEAGRENWVLELRQLSPMGGAGWVVTPREEIDRDYVGYRGYLDLAQLHARLARRRRAADAEPGQGLHQAAEGNLDALRALLDLGLDVDARELGTQRLARLRDALFDLSRLAHRRDAVHADASPQLHREHQAIRFFLSQVDLKLAAKLTLDEIASTVEGPLPEAVREKIGASEPGTLRELRRRLACWLREGMPADSAPDEEWIG